MLVAFADEVASVGMRKITDLLEDPMNRALELISRWMKENELTISTSKTVIDADS